MSNNNDTAADVVFEYTGEGCYVPKDVTIVVLFHPSVTEVEDEAFRYCNNLREVVFNDGLQKIGGSAFWDCKALSTITFPSTVTEIDSYAFIGCSNLREVVLNEGLQKIGRNAFQSCKLLSSITFPSTVTEIDNYAFCFCGNLRVVVFHGVPRKIGEDAFRYCTSLERFTFPTISSRVDSLILTGHWEELEDKVNEVRRAVERSDDGLFVTAAAVGGGRNWNQVRESLGKIIKLLSYYELKEGTSIFELALWKFMLDQVDKDNPIPRKKCRMDVAGPVKDIIMQYLS